MPNSEIDLPKALRSLAYFRETRSTFFRAAHGERPQLQPAQVQNVERDDVAAADLAQHVLDRHLHVVEIDGGGGTALDAHLLFFGARG